MSFNYIKEQYDNFNMQALESSFAVFATICIKGTEIGEESLYDGVQDILDARQSDSIKMKYPNGMDATYRIEIYITDKTGLSLGKDKQFQYSGSIVKEPYDIWISCFKSSVVVRGTNTYFDYAEQVELQGNKYNIKGIVNEDFGNKPLMHIFLVKDHENKN